MFDLTASEMKNQNVQCDDKTITFLSAVAAESRQPTKMTNDFSFSSLQ